MAVKKLNNEWQTYRIKDFSGGWASVPQKDEESLILENLEITREKWLRTVFGSYHYNSNDISASQTAKVHSVGTGSAGSFDFVVLAGTSNNKVYYGAGQDSPVSFTEITGAAALTGTYWSFAQFVNTSDVNVILMANENDDLYVWNGTGNISSIAAAPSGIGFITTYQGHVFAAVQPYDLHFSEYLDYATWPGASVIQLTSEMGKITGLAPLPDKLIIFFEAGTAMINGKNAEEFSDSFTIMTRDAGMIYPLSVSAYGSEIAANTISGPIIMDPSGAIIEYIAEPLRELFLEQDDSGFSQYSWKGLLTPFHYFLVRRSLSDVSTSRCWMYDRVNQAWTELNFPDSSFATSFALPGFLYPIDNGVLSGG